MSDDKEAEDRPANPITEAIKRRRGRPPKKAQPPVMQTTTTPPEAVVTEHPHLTEAYDETLVSLSDEQRQAIANAAAKKKKPATRPWEPASRLTIWAGKQKIKDSRYVDPTNGVMYRVRHCSKLQLAKKQSEGWEVEKSRYLTDSGVPNVDGSNIDTTKQKPDLILCRMPEDLALGREEYFNRRVDARIPAIKADLDKQVVAQGGRPYKPPGR